jgi:hypothetical protein
MGQQRDDNTQNNKEVNIEHESGLSPSGQRDSYEELEGSEEAFRMKPNWQDRGDVRETPGESDAVMGPGGDSRPDDMPNSGFTYVTEREIDENRVIPANKEDADRLEEQRVDQQDEIVGRYDPVTGGQKAELRPRETKKGAESEGL